MIRRHLLVFAALSIVLAACSQPDSSDRHATPAASTAEESGGQPQAFTTVYACTPSKHIVATYDNRNPDQPKLQLAIDGVIYDLYSVVSASGARYATEQGIQPEQGMQWHSKADKAVLMTMTLDHTAKPDDEKILFDCAEQTAR